MHPVSVSNVVDSIRNAEAAIESLSALNPTLGGHLAQPLKDLRRARTQYSPKTYLDLKSTFELSSELARLSNVIARVLVHEAMEFRIDHSMVNGSDNVLRSLSAATAEAFNFTEQVMRQHAPNR